jgi:hypothetical protein
VLVKDNGRRTLYKHSIQSLVTNQSQLNGDDAFYNCIIHGVCPLAICLVGGVILRSVKMPNIGL